MSCQLSECCSHHVRVLSSEVALPSGVVSFLRVGFTKPCTTNPESELRTSTPVTFNTLITAAVHASSAPSLQNQPKSARETSTEQQKALKKLVNHDDHANRRDKAKQRTARQGRLKSAAADATRNAKAKTSHVNASHQAKATIKELNLSFLKPASRFSIKRSYTLVSGDKSLTAANKHKKLKNKLHAK